MHRASDYDFELPETLIAREPTAARDGARLLCLSGPDAPSHRMIRDLPRLLPERAVVVVNDTRVLPARLFAEKPTGGRVELLLCDRLGPDGAGERWRAMAASGKPMRLGPLALRGQDPPAVEVLAVAAPYVELRLVPRPGEPLLGALERVGEVPLPPYIVKARAAVGDERVRLEDRARYQTVYAREPGAVAAPTAGLHLSEAVLAGLAERGIDLVRLTLHVGPGTFAPLRSDILEENTLHAERYAIAPQAAAELDEARAAGRAIVAVGTTVVRALESAVDDRGRIRAGEAETQLFIRPGFRFRVVDHLLSNFHLPRSSLLVLVAAFAGKDPVLRGYREAVAAGYRFYSYGDATLSSRQP